MKITATSTFHDSLSDTFIGLTEGYNIRRLRGPRSRYCLDYPHGCGCGYPTAHTSWQCPDGYAVAYAEECGFEGYTDGGIYGRGYLRIRIYRVPPKA